MQCNVPHDVHERCCLHTFVQVKVQINSLSENYARQQVVLNLILVVKNKFRSIIQIRFSQK